MPHKQHFFVVYCSVCVCGCVRTHICVCVCVCACECACMCVVGVCVHACVLHGCICVYVCCIFVYLWVCASDCESAWCDWHACQVAGETGDQSATCGDSGETGAEGAPHRHSLQPDWCKDRFPHIYPLGLPIVWTILPGNTAITLPSNKGNLVVVTDFGQGQMAISCLKCL